MLCYVHKMICVVLYVAYSRAWQMYDCPLQHSVCNCNKHIIIIINIIFYTLRCVVPKG